MMTSSVPRLRDAGFERVLSMRSVTRTLLWLFVFSVPWGLDAFPGVGTITRVLGIVTLGAGALTKVTEARMRRPSVIFWFALVFTCSTAVSLFWTISYEETLGRVITYIQLLGLVWIVWEFARTLDEQQSLFAAYCFGTFIPIVSLLRNFDADVRIHPDDLRYSASGINANHLALTLVIGFPIAWHLFMRHRTAAVRLVAGFYCVVAPVAIVLTGGRGAFIAGVVALSIVPLTLRRQSARVWLPVATMVVVGGIAMAAVLPSSSWTRIMTITSELQGGTLSGRTLIWDAGWRVFLDRPILGAGAGTFPVAVEPQLNRPRAAHNVPLSLLVEQGVVGLFLFGSLLLACVWTSAGLPPPERKLWAVVLLSWLVGVMSIDWHYDKITWLMFGLLAAQRAAVSQRSREQGITRKPFYRGLERQVASF
jgi:O-antigen ligase